MSIIFAIFQIFTPKYLIKQIWEFRKLYWCTKGKEEDFTLIINEKYTWTPTVINCPTVEPSQKVFVFMCKVPEEELTIKSTVICYKGRVLKYIFHDACLCVKKDDVFQITYTFVGLIK